MEEDPSLVLAIIPEIMAWVDNGDLPMNNVMEG